MQGVLQLPTEELLRGAVQVKLVDAGDFIMRQDSMQVSRGLGLHAS